VKELIFQRAIRVGAIFADADRRKTGSIDAQRSDFRVSPPVDDVVFCVLVLFPAMSALLILLGVWSWRAAQRRRDEPSVHVSDDRIKVPDAVPETR